jgi:hypothetical protein
MIHDVDYYELPGDLSPTLDTMAMKERNGDLSPTSDTVAIERIATNLRAPARKSDTRTRVSKKGRRRKHPNPSNERRSSGKQEKELYLAVVSRQVRITLKGGTRIIK